MTEQSSDSPMPPEGGHEDEFYGEPGLLKRLNPFRKKSNGDVRMRDTLEDLLEDREEMTAPLGAEEAELVRNVLGLRERTVEDVCVPRSDIIAVSADTPLEEIVETMTREGHSRLPVYGENLDDPIGMVHIKDIVSYLHNEKPFNLTKLCRKVLYVSPSARVLELLLEMRTKRTHMALVVDEYGGTDGLLSIEDLVEEIVGEIEDEHDRPEGNMYTLTSDGRIDADARWDVYEFQNITGVELDEEETLDIDTLGGLVFFIAGHVPVRGEVVTHQASGMEFEILEADPRRIHKLRIQNLPKSA